MSYAPAKRPRSNCTIEVSWVDETDIEIIIRVHHVQKYTRAILPHAALIQNFTVK